MWVHPINNLWFEKGEFLCYTLTFANMKTSSSHGTECQSESLISYLVLFRIHYGNSELNLESQFHLKSNLLSR